MRPVDAVKEVAVDRLEVELFDGPAEPELDVVGGPKSRICKDREINLSDFERLMSQMQKANILRSTNQVRMPNN